MTTRRTVLVDAASRHAPLHLAALRTLPGRYAITRQVGDADVIAGDAAFLRDALMAGAAAGIAVVLDPFAQDWKLVDAVWELASRGHVRVELASLVVETVANLRELAMPILSDESPFIVDVHMQSLGAAHARLAQVIGLLAALGIECPTPDLHATNDGWLAGTNDARVTLRARCVNSTVMAPLVRVTLTNGSRQVSIEVPLAGDATPVHTIVRSATGTTHIEAPPVSPARAFWQALA